MPDARFSPLQDSPFHQQLQQQLQLAPALLHAQAAAARSSGAGRGEGRECSERGGVEGWLDGQREVAEDCRRLKRDGGDLPALAGAYATHAFEGEGGGCHALRERGGGIHTLREREREGGCHGTG